MEFPLASLRVLDLSRVLAGPFAGRMLADLGADVVKVEPPEGDITRGWGAIRHGIGGYYTQQNAGKRTLCVDLDAPGGAALLLRLAQRADVLIENFRPGVLAKHGLGWERLHPLNPRLVMLSISGFGASSPEAERPAYASVLHAESGILARQAQFDLGHEQFAVGPADQVVELQAQLELAHLADAGGGDDGAVAELVQHLQHDLGARRVVDQLHRRALDLALQARGQWRVRLEADQPQRLERQLRLAAQLEAAASEGCKAQQSEAAVHPAGAGPPRGGWRPLGGQRA